MFVNRVGVNLAYPACVLRASCGKVEGSYRARGQENEVAK